MRQCGDVVCVDATSSVDRVNSLVFHLVTPTPAGGLSCGMLITSSQSTEVMTEAFTMLRDKCLPTYAFYKKNGDKIGPKLWMTDDAEPEITALR